MKRLLSISIVFLVVCAVFVSPTHAIMGKLEIKELTKIADRKVPVWVYDKKSGQLIGQAEYLVDKQGWYFNFPERSSEYIAVWPGGELLMTSPSITKNEIYNYSGAAAATSLGLGLAALTLGESGDSTEYLEPPPSSVPTCDELGGSYAVDGPQISNSCSEAEASYTRTATVSCVSGFVVIVIARFFDTMNGSFDDESGAVQTAGSSQDESTAYSFQGTAKKDLNNINAITISGLLSETPSSNCRTIYDVDFVKNLN